MNTHIEKAQGKKDRLVANEVSQLQSGERINSQFVDNRPEAIAQRKLQRMADIYTSQQSVIQNKDQDNMTVMLKKDAALWSAGDKEDGFTSTKVIKTKQGTTGLFRYPMNGNIIDSFINTNVADESIDRPAEYEGAKKMEIPIAVDEHNLGQTYGDVTALDEGAIVHGTRPTHFAHADDSHGVDRVDTYTWHHKNKIGKMELIDMNVHGGMWHYGGIAGWTASLHDGTSTDDDPGID